MAWESIFDNTKWAGVASSGSQCGMVWTGGTYWRAECYAPIKAFNAYLTPISGSMTGYAPTKIRVTHNYVNCQLIVYCGGDVAYSNSSYTSGTEGTLALTGDITKIEVWRLTFLSAIYVNITNIEFLAPEPEAVVYDSVKNVNQFEIVIDDTLTLAPSQLNLAKTYIPKSYDAGGGGGPALYWSELNHSLTATIPDVSHYDDIIDLIGEGLIVVNWTKQIIAGVASKEELMSIGFDNSTSGNGETLIIAWKANPVINYSPNGNSISLQCSYTYASVSGVGALDNVEITATPSLIKKVPSFEYGGDLYEMTWPHPVSGVHDARRNITYGDITFRAAEWQLSAGNKSMSMSMRESKTITVYEAELLV